MLCGLRWLKLLERLENFLIRLRDVGCKMVFFIEDPLIEQKTPDWLKHKTKEYKKMCNVLAQMKRGRKPEVLKDMVSQKRVLDLTKEFLYQRLCKYGQWKRPLEADQDLECPRYAFENEAFAVFTENLDFLIYEGEYRVWFVNNIDFEQMTTRELHKVNFCKKLGLTTAQMPVFAMMCGNEVMKKCYLKEFHEKLEPGSKLTAIAKYCKGKPDIHLFLTHECYLMAEFLNCPLDSVRETLKVYDLVRCYIFHCKLFKNSIIYSS